jgi:hypothetical protein
MTRAPALAVLLAACLGNAACESSLTDPPVLPPLARGGSDLPFKESYEAAGTIAPAASCSPGTVLVALQGGGTATHMGRYTISNSHCLDLATGAFTSGVFVKTAPDGDRLVGTYGGGGTILEAPTPPDLVGRFAISGAVEFAGGTGRYADASGTAVMRGTQVTDFSAQDWPTQISLDMEGSFSW